jgi:hypothetical protein
MGLIQIMTRVKLPTREEIESDIDNESLGITKSNGKWCWRRRTIMSSDIIELVSFDANHTLVMTEYSGTIFVRETYDSLHKKWQAVYEMANEEEIAEEDEREKRRSDEDINEEGENNSDEDDE